MPIELHQYLITGILETCVHQIKSHVFDILCPDRHAINGAVTAYARVLWVAEGHSDSQLENLTCIKV